MVQFHERLIVEFLTRLAKRAVRDFRIGSVRMMNRFEKIVEFDLQCVFQQVQNKKNDGGEGEPSIASEIIRGFSVAREEIIRK